MNWPLTLAGLYLTATLAAFGAIWHRYGWAYAGPLLADSLLFWGFGSVAAIVILLLGR
jgi:hypothetical protein